MGIPLVRALKHRTMSSSDWSSQNKAMCPSSGRAMFLEVPSFVLWSAPQIGTL